MGKHVLASQNAGRIQRKARHAAKVPSSEEAALLCEMGLFVQRSELRARYGERISEADALRLFESNDLNALGAIADLAQQKQVYLDG